MTDDKTTYKYNAEYNARIIGLAFSEAGLRASASIKRFAAFCKDENTKLARKQACQLTKEAEELDEKADKIRKELETLRVSYTQEEDQEAPSSGKATEV